MKKSGIIVVFLGFLAAIFIIPTIATADRLEATPPRVATEEDLAGEIEEVPPVNWTNLLYRTVTPIRCLNTAAQFGIVPGGWSVVSDLEVACGIPWPEAKAVHINIAVYNETGAGNLRAFAYGDPVPNAAVLNYGQIPGLFALSNAAIIPLCGQGNAAVCPYDIEFYVSRTCNFNVDAFGFFF
jgi:hypothetical protein